MVFLPVIGNLIGILNDKSSANQIALAAALGAMAALLPGFGLISLCLFIVIFLLNVNIAAAFLAMASFKPVGFLLDPIAHKVGLILLVKTPALKPFWTLLYNLPFVPFTRFNNTVVLGSLALGLLAFPFIFILTRTFVNIYREKWRAHINKWKVVQIIKANKIFLFYQKVRGL